ncbi:MAG: SulP family inorganic anion transporter [Phycisphaeraceae bacterium]
MSAFTHAILQPLRPTITTVRHYNLHKFRRDIVAGLTVSVVEVPQAMAYALIAGVPPQYGLYTSVFQGILGALLSSSEHLTTGPTNTQSLLIASAVTRLLSMSNTTGFSPEQSAALYLELVFGLTLLKGLIQLGFAAAQMGNMVRYVSRSVIIGVASGAGVLIIVGQLPNFLGIELPGAGEHHLPGALGAIERLLPHLGQVNLRAVLLGGGCVAVIALMRWISKMLPGALTAVVLAAAMVGLLGWTGVTPTIQPIHAALPGFHIPGVTWAQSEALFGGAVALALLGMLESVAIVKAIAAKSGEHINPNQEFFAQGFKNFVTAFFQCIPGSGSFTRSALDYMAGAETRFAAVFNALFVAVIYLFFADWARYIPLAALAAVLFVIAVGLIDIPMIVRLFRAHRADGWVCLTTFAATVILPLEYAIFIGIFLSLAMHIRQTSRLHLFHLVHQPGGIYIERPLRDRAGSASVVLFLQLEGDLFFGVADELQERLMQVVLSPVRVMVIRLKRTHSVDSTVLAVIEDVTRKMQARGGHIVLCGVKSELMDVFHRGGLTKLIGVDNVFPTQFGVFASAKAALRRARELAGCSIDDDALLAEEEADRRFEDWSYQI